MLIFITVKIKNVVVILIIMMMSYLNAYERLDFFTRTYEFIDFDEFAVFLPSFLAMGFILFSFRKIEELESEIKKRKQAEEAARENEQRYKDLSITDALTQIHNSRHFHSKLKVEIDRAIRYSHPLSLLLIDIDNFKKYNDAYGHLEGDRVLSSFGKVIRDCVRNVDSAFRYGGEEFTVILPETEANEAVNVAEKLRKRFEAEIFSPGPNEAVYKTVSIGVSQYEPEEEPKSFIKRADKAMYMAKERGKNRVLFETDHDAHTLRIVEWKIQFHKRRGKGSEVSMKY